MSIVKVAKLAGVSHATVSRVINHHPRVSAASAKRVKAAMRELNYKPPSVRRGPRSKVRDGIRTHNVALLFLGADVSLQHVPVISTLVRGVERALAEHEMNFSLAHVEPNKPLPRNVASGDVDGVILIGQEPSADVVRKLRELPTVWLGSRASSKWGDHVSPDHEAVGRLAAKYLIEHGRKRLAVINIEVTHPGQQAYMKYFVDHAESQGVDVVSFAYDAAQNDKLIRPHAEESVLAEYVGRVLARSPRPDGLYVVSDLQAAVVQRLLRQGGVDVGQEILLVSTNNEQVLLAGLDPKPATIDHGAEVLGKRAVEQLLWRMRHPDESRRVKVTVEPRLVLPDGSIAVDEPIGEQPLHVGGDH